MRRSLQVVTVGQPDGVASFAREDWLFIDPSKHNCPEDQKPHLLEYEYAREAVAYGLNCPSAPTWHLIFGDRFPRTPFLAFDSVERKRLLTEAFEGVAGKLPLFDFTRGHLGLSYQFEYSLTPEYQDQLETLHEHTRKDLKISELQRSYEEAISGFKKNLPKEAYDKSIAHVRLTLRFDHPDNQLEEAFAAMLKEIRQTAEPKPSTHKKMDARLKRLAATRLYRIFQTTEKARAYAYDQGFENLYKDAGGWSRARVEVWRTLGVNAFPPKNNR